MTFVFVMLIVVVAAAIAYLKFSGLAGPSQPPEWLPRELEGAKEFCRERQFSAHVEGFEVIAKPDRVYKLPGDGRLCVIEYKTRPGADKIYDGDVWQLSAGAAALSGVGAVADFGFVIVQDRETGQRRSHRVSLLNHRSLREVMQRHSDVECGAVVPAKSKSKRKCSSCGHRETCQNT
jgi:CRISPR/Cas system-associated exonuclease Cas4 (RecB family)